MSESAQLSVRVPAEMAYALERIAHANDRSLSQELRRLIRLRIAEVDGPSPTDSMGP